jgi:hypothetical protein
MTDELIQKLGHLVIGKTESILSAFFGDVDMVNYRK